MSTRRPLLLLAFAGVALVLSACRGGGGDVTPTPAAGSASPTPVEGKVRTVTSDDGKLTITIPAGALGEEIEITITAVALEELPEELQVLRGAGTGYRLEPDGLEFSEPVTASLELDRAELEGQPEDGITAYGLVSLAQDGERELIQELVTEASLGEAKVVVRGEISHLSWLTMTRGSLTVTLEEVPKEQPAGGTFTARATAKNTTISGAITLGPTVGTFLAAGGASVPGNPYFYRQATLGPAEEIESTGSFECGGSPGAGTYGVRVFTTSRVAVEEGEPQDVQLTVLLDSVVECGDDGDGSGEAFELPPPGEYRFTVTGTIEIEFSEAGVSAAPLATGQRQTGEVAGDATVNLFENGDFTFGDLNLGITVRRDGDTISIDLRQNPEQPSTGNLGPDGTKMELNPKATLPSGETATSEAPIKLESDDHVGADSSVALTTPADALPPYYKVEFAEFTANFLIVLLDLGEFSFFDDEEELEEAEPPEPQVKLGCDHRIPGQESDVIVKLTNLQPGQLVTGTVTGPAVIGDGLFSAAAGDEGTAEARVPISQYGTYNVSVDGQSGSDSIDVGDVCTAP